MPEQTPGRSGTLLAMPAIRNRPIRIVTGLDQVFGQVREHHPAVRQRITHHLQFVEGVRAENTAEHGAFLYALAQRRRLGAQKSALRRSDDVDARQYDLILART